MSLTALSLRPFRSRRGGLEASKARLLALCALLGGKARREERQLVLVHPEYGAYRLATPAIIPGLPWLDWRAL